MNDDHTQRQEHRRDDPLGLRGLPQLTPGADGWPAIRAALEDRQEPDGRARRGRLAPLAWLATAACLVIVVGVVVRQDPEAPPTIPSLAGADPASGIEAAPSDASVQDLIVLSQLLEYRLRGLRARTGTMPAESAVYVAELEDLIARVDSELSDTPDAPALWSQRVNLLLDLEVLFQHQFDREYGRMASL